MVQYNIKYFYYKEHDVSVNISDCIKIDFTVAEPIASKTVAPSPWHCRQGCEEHTDCRFFSFDFSGKRLYFLYFYLQNKQIARYRIFIVVISVSNDEENCLFSISGMMDQSHGFLTGSGFCNDFSIPASTATTTIASTTKTTLMTTPNATTELTSTKSKNLFLLL